MVVAIPNCLRQWEDLAVCPGQGRMICHGHVALCHAQTLSSTACDCRLWLASQVRTALASHTCGLWGRTQPCTWKDLVVSSHAAFREFWTRALHFHAALGPTDSVGGPTREFYPEPVQMEAWATDRMCKNSLKIIWQLSVFFSPWRENILKICVCFSSLCILTHDHIFGQCHSHCLKEN